MMNSFQTTLGHHPILLQLISNGRIGFIPQFRDTTIVDYAGALEVTINNFGINIVDTDSRDEEQYTFGTQIEYKNKPLLLEWLKSFNMKFEMF
jgi:hypothetical protein